MSTARAQRTQVESGGTVVVARAPIVAARPTCVEENRRQPAPLLGYTLELA